MATAIHQYEDKLLDFAYGELPAPEASAVESHLKACARCSQALDQIRGVRTTMAALPMEPAPASGLDSLLAYAEQAAARHAAAPRPGAPWWRRVVAPLAGACALTLVAVVAIKSQDDLDLSAETAALEAQPRTESPPPAPVAAAPVVAQEKAKAELPEEIAPQEVAAKLKTGKVRGGAEAERNAKEDRAWDPAPQRDGLARNKNEGYEQAFGETKGPAEERQLAQRQELGNALGTAQKESKSRREAPSTEADYGNARGGYVQGKKKSAPDSDKVADALNDSTAVKGGGSSAPMGITTASKPSAPPPSKSAAAAPAPADAPEPSAAPVAKAQPSPKPAPSLGLSMPGSTSTGSAYKQQPGRSSEDESAARAADDLVDRKRLSKDVDYQQRDQELAARGYLDAARSASNQGNRQEEVTQALAVLQTNVKGATRAEALSRLCTALEQLGEEGQADRYCDALLREFPNTTAAKQVANRRNNVQRSAPAAKSPSKRSDDEAAEKAEPAKAAPAEEKPAAAH